MLASALALLLVLLSPPASTYEADWTSLLDRVVTDEGLVRYGELDGPLRAEFDAIVERIEAFDAGALQSDAEKMAFWMNAYNVKLIERVLALGMPPSIEDHGFDAFFKTPVRVAGRDLTLDQIEHVILRRQDGPAEVQALAVGEVDPRVHVGLNCGAVSCPRLRSRAFTPANLDAELDRAMREFANAPRHFRADGRGVVASSLIDWFGPDFDAHEPAGDYLLGFMNEERPGYDQLRQAFAGRSAAEIKALPNVRFSYDWALNTAG